MFVKNHTPLNFLKRSIWGQVVLLVDATEHPKRRLSLDTESNFRHGHWLINASPYRGAKLSLIIFGCCNRATLLIYHHHKIVKVESLLRFLKYVLTAYFKCKIHCGAEQQWRGWQTDWEHWDQCVWFLELLHIIYWVHWNIKLYQDILLSFFSLWCSNTNLFRLWHKPKEPKRKWSTHLTQCFFKCYYHGLLISAVYSHGRGMSHSLCQTSHMNLCGSWFTSQLAS